MRGNWPKCFAAVLQHEGGFVNHPRDPGGMTNLGVTRNVWGNWIGKQPTEAQMRALSALDVEPLYRNRYWNTIRGDELPSGVDYVVFDAAVNSGPVRAIKWLQACVDVPVDGKLGDQTLDAVFAANKGDLVDEYCDRRLAFLVSLPIWRTFGKGWKRRVTEVLALAETMVR